MINIVLSILSSVGILILFRLFQHYNIPNRKGIMINYAVACIAGLIVFRVDTLWFDRVWFLPSVLLGVFFYLVFNLMAKVTQENGVTVSSIATKMSVVIPVLVGLLFLDESFSFSKIMAVIIGLLAVVLSSGERVKSASFLWPLLLFLGSGLIDTSLNLFQVWAVTEAAFPLFMSNVFGFAFVSALIHHLYSSSRTISRQTLIGGVLLGLVNFSALLFILRALAIEDLESSFVFPLNNFGIIGLSTMVAMTFFKESMNLKSWIGLLFAGASILILFIDW